MDTTYHKGFKSSSMTVIMDSNFRNMSDWPKVEEFSYGHGITSSWPMYKGSATDKKKVNLKLINVVIPYRAALLTKKYFLVSISHSDDNMNRKLLNGSSSPGYHRSNFVVTVGKVIDTDWIYLSPITGVIPTTIIFGGEFSFKIHDSLGNDLVINTVEDATLPENQVSVIFELIPS